ncbi:MAG: hypothetical protein JXB29_09045 [Sedimentisphaerales bacterium]|nr:hypothetical protein [Sedimentisphaerales bacterium]
MKLELDVKTLVVGLILGIIVTIALGAAAGSADKADFGIAIENRGSALVRTEDGSFYIVDSQKAEAKRVQYEEGRAGQRYLKSITPSVPQK